MGVKWLETLYGAVLIGFCVLHFFNGGMASDFLVFWFILATGIFWCLKGYPKWNEEGETENE